MKTLLYAGCVLAAVSMSGNARAATPDPHIAALEARIQALEANAESLRAQAAEALEAVRATRAEMEQLKQAQQTPVAAEPPPAAVANANGNAFNPAISIVLDGRFAEHSLDQDRFVSAGLPVPGEYGPGTRGFGLGESEISFAANIDEKFYGQLTLAIESADGEDSLGVEEAYIDVNSLPAGFALRAGRFFSNIGYLNNHHAHTDAFSDRPLVYREFLDSQYGDDGVQARWVAPTELYLEFGGELLSGRRYPGSGSADNGAGVRTLFAHVGGDLGVESSWLFGLSALDSNRNGAEVDALDRLYVADLTWKWAPQGNYKDGGVQLRAEYLIGDRFEVSGSDLEHADDQARGFYLEGVYRINRQWETGYRYDRTWPGEIDGSSPAYPRAQTAMLTWRNSEFSLLRLSFSQERPSPSATDNGLTLQYQTNLGAHGAHKF
jgi:hypothetical protein